MSPLSEDAEGVYIGSVAGPLRVRRTPIVTGSRTLVVLVWSSVSSPRVKSDMAPLVCGAPWRPKARFSPSADPVLERLFACFGSFGRPRDSGEGWWRGVLNPATLATSARRVPTGLVLACKRGKTPLPHLSRRGPLSSGGRVQGEPRRQTLPPPVPSGPGVSRAALGVGGRARGGG